MTTHLYAGLVWTFLSGRLAEFRMMGLQYYACDIPRLFLREAIVLEASKCSLREVDRPAWPTTLTLHWHQDFITYHIPLQWGMMSLIYNLLQIRRYRTVHRWLYLTRDSIWLPRIGVMTMAPLSGFVWSTSSILQNELFPVLPPSCL